MAKTEALPLSHRLLCDLAVKWLQRPKSRQGPGCQFAFSESRGAWDGEIPDAIGFRAGVFNEASVLVEVKVSRGDFLADVKKPHRVEPAKGMGAYRYFMVPEGLISADELPEKWGLIEVTRAGAIKVRTGHVFLKYRDVDTWRHEHAREREWTLLARMLIRVGDVERVQNALKESQRIQARLTRECDELRESVRELQHDASRARRLAAASN
jgi:hypothetical protein